MDKNLFFSESFLKQLSYIYCTDNEGSKFYAERFKKAVDDFEKIFGKNREIRLFSAPGRTEIGGNHTDHQHGRVLAGSVDLDIIAVVSPNDSNIIKVKSEGYKLNTVNIDETSINKKEYNTTLSLIRGISASFKNMGYNINGFDAYMTSRVLKGSGLSSSAAFEVMIGTILNEMFCDGKETAVKIAQIGQYAENVYFGKPCGLMDQTASSVGGFVTIDFKDNENPIVEKIDFDFASCGYSLCIIDTGGNHADLTPDYASVPKEMKSVAEFFNKNVLREVPKEDFYKNIGKLREVCGDRAILRAAHFYDDDERVPKEVLALKNNNFEEFKNLIIESGHSSYMYLQNVFSCINPSEQGISLALMLCEKLLKGKGAYRVHGGGFAGTIQAFVPNDMLSEFKKSMEDVFGKDKCYILSIRPVGGVELKLQ